MTFQIEQIDNGWLVSAHHPLHVQAYPERRGRRFCKDLEEAFEYIRTRKGPDPR